MDNFETCHICYEESSNMKKTKCNHMFCKSCFNKWMEEHDTCPMCRKQILSIKSDEQCLNEWYNWKNISKFCKIVVFDRPGYSLKCLNSIASKKLRKKDWQFIKSKKIYISSSILRKI